MEHIKAIARYCAENIEDYEIRVQRALDVIGRNRCPLYMADSALYDEILECAQEWCDDNEISVDFFEDIDAEEILFTEP